MKILVTGATGVYGRSVVERLQRAGHDVVAMARRLPRALPRGVRFAQGDVAEAGDVLGAMDGCEAVVHLAFVVSPIKDRQESRRISVGGTQNVVDAMQQTGARRLVFASSAMSYGSNPDNPPLFHEDDPQRPAADYVYGSDKVAAERVILESGVDAVIARTAVTVGRNIDNLLVDIFAGPAIVGIKGVDIRYQLVHQEDVGRFLAYAVEHGPSGPVNVAPPDFLELRRIAELLGKRFVEVSKTQAIRGVTFAWEHDLMDITPGEAAGISYMPRLATDRLRDVWGFECAWSTADAALDLRRAVTGRASVARRRFELPWRLRFPVQTAASPTGESELDTTSEPEHPTYTAVTACHVPLPALTLTTTAHLLRAAATGTLDALGVDRDTRFRLGGVSAGIIRHRLFVNDDLAPAIAEASRRRRRVIASRYADEVTRLTAWTDQTLAAAHGLDTRSDGKLEAILSALRDDLAWFWSIAATGAALDGRALSDLDPLLTLLPEGATLAAVHGPVSPRPPGRHGRARAHAERTALALSQALAAAVRERARRLKTCGVLMTVDDAAHLTWDELAAPPTDAVSTVERRRAEHERLTKLSVPRTVSLVTPAGAPA